MPIDYSKWKTIEVSDDEDDTHPNIDTPSLFRWRHQARLERMAERKQAKDEVEAGKRTISGKVQVEPNWCNSNIFLHLRRSKKNWKVQTWVRKNARSYSRRSKKSRNKRKSIYEKNESSKNKKGLRHGMSTRSDMRLGARQLSTSQLKRSRISRRKTKIRRTRLW